MKQHQPVVEVIEEERPFDFRKLRTALIWDAFRVIQRAKWQNKPFRETFRWFTSDNRAHAFSFLKICEELGLDPHRFRCLVRNMAERVPTRNAYRNATWRRKGEVIPATEYGVDMHQDPPPPIRLHAVAS